MYIKLLLVCLFWTNYLLGSVLYSGGRSFTFHDAEFGIVQAVFLDDGETKTVLGGTVAIVQLKDLIPSKQAFIEIGGPSPTPDTPYRLSYISSRGDRTEIMGPRNHAILYYSPSLGEFIWMGDFALPVEGTRPQPFLDSVQSAVESAISRINKNLVNADLDKCGAGGKSGREGDSPSTKKPPKKNRKDG